METQTYIMEEATRVTYENLPEELQKQLTLSNLETILEMKFLADDENIGQTTRMCIKNGLDVTEEIVQAVALAEEVYFRQIGVIAWTATLLPNFFSMPVTLSWAFLCHFTHVEPKFNYNLKKSAK